LIKSVICLALAAIGMNAQAGEGYKLRQSAVGLFGGEMAASADNPGFFGTVGLTSADIYKIVDGSGNKIVLPGRTVPLPTGTPTGGALPNGTYSVVVPDGTIDFSQKQTQVNLVGGYLTEGTYADGKIAFAVNIPLIKQSRTFITTQGTGVVSPTPPAAMPAPLKGAIAAVAAAVNAQVVAGVAAQAATQNVDTSGIGDTELSMLWVHHVDRLKVVAGASLYVPTGSYDKNRGPNPGFGNFYTLRPGVAVTYSLNKNHTDSAWDAGVTIAGRVSYGFNTTNKDTDYRSGNFLYAEAGITKVTGDWAFGANVLVVQQTTDDSGTGAPADGARYKNYGAGPFISYKIPGMDAGFNLHYTENFGSQNALVARTVQLRFIRAW
jgi:hypothetical protein